MKDYKEIMHIEKDGLEFSISYSQQLERLVITSPERQDFRVDTDRDQWVGPVLCHLYRIDPDCVLDATIERRIKGILLVSVSSMAQVRGFNLVLPQN